MPANGVYAVKISARDRCYDGVANVGLRPTFDKKDLTLEAHIFDFNEDLYGEEVSTCFIRKIREEKKFLNVEALIKQQKASLPNKMYTGQSVNASSNVRRSVFKRPLAGEYHRHLRSSLITCLNGFEIPLRAARLNYFFNDTPTTEIYT